MNDFTKEELEFIKRCVKPFSWLWKDDFDEIVHKIQSLIDNYCEHDGEIGKDYAAEKCMKCGAYWE